MLLLYAPESCGGNQNNNKERPARPAVSADIAAGPVWPLQKGSAILHPLLKIAIGALKMKILSPYHDP
jgi:hypothetical protein